MADALTRLSDGTASTPRAHRLPRFPRIPSRLCPLPLPVLIHSRSTELRKASRSTLKNWLFLSAFTQVAYQDDKMLPRRGEWSRRVSERSDILPGPEYRSRCSSSQTTTVARDIPLRLQVGICATSWTPRMHVTASEALFYRQDTHLPLFSCVLPYYTPTEVLSLRNGPDCDYAALLTAHNART